MVDIPAVFNDVLVLEWQCQAVHDVLQGPIDLFHCVQLNDVQLFLGMVGWIMITGIIIRAVAWNFNTKNVKFLKESIHITIFHCSIT